MEISYLGQKIKGDKVANGPEWQPEFIWASYCRSKDEQYSPLTSNTPTCLFGIFLIMFYGIGVLTIEIANKGDTIPIQYL